jgi:outer membrane lipoprotein-sorting protein
MASLRRHDWLDEAILAVAPNWRPRTDFSTWRTTHPDALKSLGLQTTTGAQRCARRRPLTRLAIAAGIVIVAALGLHSLGPSIEPASRAFARVLHNVGNSTTIQFDVTSRAPTGEVLTGRVYEKDGYLVRTVINVGNAASWDTILRDKRGGTSLYLDTRSKKAWHPGPRLRFADANPSIYDLFKDFLNSPGYSISKLGDKQIEGRMAVGFRLSRTDTPVGPVTYAIRADSMTMRPIRIDVTGQTPQGGTFEQTITNIVFDEVLDESLFDFQPQGYQFDPPTM